MHSDQDRDDLSSYQKIATAALRLHWKTYPSIPARSVRVSDVAKITQLVLTSRPEKQRFLVVCGPKGVGKSTAVGTGTVLSKQQGVLYVSISSNLEDAQVVQNEVYDAIWQHTHLSMLSRKPRQAALLVLKVHRFFWGVPWVVLDVATIKGTVPGVTLTAARALCRDGMNVLIDASQGVFGPNAASSERAVLIYLDFMDWDTVCQIPQLGTLFKKLEACNLLMRVKAVVGGSPMALEELEAQIPAGASPEEIETVVMSYLGGKLTTAALKVDNFLTGTPEAKQFLKLFETRDHIPAEECTIPHETMEVVLRIKGGNFYPRNPAIGFVLRYDVRSSFAEKYIREWKG